MAEAVYDKVSADLAVQGKALEQHVRALVAEVFGAHENKTLDACRSYEASLSTTAKVFGGDLENRLEQKALHLEQALHNKMADAGHSQFVVLREAYEKHLEHFTKRLEDSLLKVVRENTTLIETRMKAVEHGLLERNQKDLAMQVAETLKSVQDRYDDYLQNTKELLASLPVTQVSLVVPDKAIAVRVDQTLQLPARKTTTEKTIEYSPTTGRPEKIHEEVVEDSK